MVVFNVRKGISVFFVSFKHKNKFKWSYLGHKVLYFVSVQLSFFFLGGISGLKP